MNGGLKIGSKEEHCMFKFIGGCSMFLSGLAAGIPVITNYPGMAAGSMAEAVFLCIVMLVVGVAFLVIADK